MYLLKRHCVYLYYVKRACYVEHAMLSRNWSRNCWITWIYYSLVLSLWPWHNLLQAWRKRSEKSLLTKSQVRKLAQTKLCTFIIHITLDIQFSQRLSNKLLFITKTFRSELPDYILISLGTLLVDSRIERVNIKYDGN